jgi:mRNA interferase MazF
MTTGYIPDRGDIVWLNSIPQSGHEQAGKRPALVVSPYSYNKKVDLALFFPITSKVKGYPFETALPSDLRIKDVVLSDQIKSLDWRVRKVEFICKVPEDITKEVIKKLNVLIRI